MSLNRVVVITGSAQGLGKGIAEKLGEQGYKIVLSDINEEVLNQALEEFKAKNFEVTAFVSDVSKQEDHLALVEHAVATFNKLDVYINNAGVEGDVEEIEKIDPANVDFVLNVNVKGVLFGIQAAAKQLKKQGHGGTIINASSIA